MYERIQRLLAPLALAAAAVLVVVLANENRTLHEQVLNARRREILPYAGFVVPAFGTTTLSGDTVTIGQAAPGSHQVLFIFDTKCGFCADALPLWKDLFRRRRSSEGEQMFNVCSNG